MIALSKSAEPVKIEPQSLGHLSDAAHGPRRRINASYDAARTSDEFKNYWANADAYDADSANSRSVRENLVQRSRYDTGNNGYSDGIAQTYATDLVGLGPTLRMQTGSEGFNRMVELAWFNWTKAVKLRRKLWCQAHAKHQDGEGFGVIRQNKNIKHLVKVDYQIYETEQFQTPLLPFLGKGQIDGMEFDEFGNPTFYNLLREHPGSINSVSFDSVPERIPARFVMHWFKMRRPGQHRGVPECSSTLNLGAASRRWREAVLSAAESIASFTLFLKTTMDPDAFAATNYPAVSGMSTLEIQKRMMTALPMGYDAFQPKSEQPTATHAEFSKTLVNEQARPKSMPYNKAACDSSSYNYASGRLDHQTYYGALDVERADCNDLVLDPLFDVWFEMAILVYGWLGGNPDVIGDGAKSHIWDWPKHQVADIGSEANATDKNLKNGTTSLTSVYSAAGNDYEDDLIKQSTANGVSVEQQRQINMLLNLPQHVIPIVSQMLGITPSVPTPGANNAPA